MSCETSQIKYTGNGSTTTYTFPFTYYVSTDVYVQLYNFTTHVWDTTTDWTFQNATTIQFNTAPPAPPSTEVKPNIKIGRNTDVEPMPATFYPGSAIRAQDLNSNFEVLQLAVEESKCADDITIDNLTDVNINNPTEGQYLVYDDTDNVWENQDAPIIGDGTIQIKSYGSNDSASSDFSVNQTNTEQIILPQISYPDLKNVPSETVTGVGDGLELVGNTVQVDLFTSRSGGAGLEFSNGDLQTTIASSSVLGSVKAGSGINIDANGKISAISNASTTYRGTANLTTSASGQLNPSTPEVKDLYINTTSGTIDASWVGLAGQSTIIGDMVVWSGTSWDLIPTGAGGVPNLQLVTDAGNFTTNGININQNISLNADGSATFDGTGEFDGNVSIGGSNIAWAGDTGTNIYPSQGIVVVTDRDNQGINIYKTGVQTQGVSLLSDGSGKFAGTIQTGVTEPTTGTGSWMQPNGGIYTVRANGSTDAVFAGYQQGSASPNVSLGADGSANFANTVFTSNQFYTTGRFLSTATGDSEVFTAGVDGVNNIRMYANGNATFAGSVNITGNLQSGAAFNVGNGVQAFAGGGLYVRQDGADASNRLFTLLNGGSAEANQVTRMYGDGSATFTGTVTADSFVTNSGLPVGGSPTGSVTMFAGATVPDGWLECNGQAAPSALAAVLGTSNVPDLRGEFVRGFDNGRGVDSGRTLLSTQSDELKSHDHTYQSNSVGNSVTGGPTPIGDGQQDNTTSSTGGSETRPRNVALMYIIKT